MMRKSVNDITSRATLNAWLVDAVENDMDPL